MKVSHWMTIWPGLVGLWLRGGGGSLALAIGFAMALNLALLATFVWPQVLSLDLPRWAVPLSAWVLVLWFWVVGRRGSSCILAQEAAKSLQPDAVSDTLLAEAQTEYLKNHWLEAESLLVRLLLRRPGDAEARLLLAAVYRRSSRVDKAREQLRELSQLASAARWREEIALEIEQLSRQLAAEPCEQEHLVNSPISSQRQAA